MWVNGRVELNQTALMVVIYTTFERPFVGAYGWAHLGLSGASLRGMHGGNE